MLQNFYNTEAKFKAFVNNVLAEELIAPNSKKESLETIFEPPSPPHVKAFYEFLKTHVVLEIKGMGIGIRETRTGLAELTELHGFDYLIVKKFIQDFEVSILNQHYDSKTEKP